jgi:hypothetical protein
MGMGKASFAAVFVTAVLAAAPVRADLASAVDSSSLPFTTGGSANWYEDYSTFTYGSSSVRSGYMTDNQSSYMQTVVSGTGTISFYWKVSSESNYDWLSFYIDGTRQDRISGTSTTAWAMKTYSASNTGTHTLKWEYSKDVSSSNGSDAGWVDRITWSGGSTNMTWTTKTSMPTSRNYLGVAATNNKIYAIGGSNGSYLGTVQAYDPSTNSWATKAVMTTARSGLAAAMMPTGTFAGYIYAVGGTNGSVLSTNQRYDPWMDSWTTQASMNSSRSGLALAAVNGMLYAIGGFNGSWAVSTVEEFSPSSNYWSYVSSMSYPRYDLAVAVVNNKIYAIGGHDSSMVYDYVEEYDPGMNSWTYKSSMPTARYGLAAAVYNGKIYAIGGYSSTSVLNTVEEYDPATDTWATRGSLTTARYGLGADTVNSKIYAIGGYGSYYLSTVEEGTITTTTGTTVPGTTSNGPLSPAVARTGMGKLVIAPNVLERKNPASVLGFALHGNAGGKVTIYIFNASGGGIDEFDLSLDSAGYGTHWYVGPNNSPLAPGVYWAKAFGSGVNDRKPFMVVGRKSL